MSRKKRNNKREYPNGGDGMFFYHKKTGHPAKQISHTDKTWTNYRYTHNPNRMKDYILDLDYSTPEQPVYRTKHLFTDSIYTRSRPFNMTKNKKSVD